MVYRIEVSPNNRAGCKNTECKNAGIKISKGQMRFGAWVEGPEFQSWSWKHWLMLWTSVLIHQEAN